jgi:hypothetical protein
MLVQLAQVMLVPHLVYECVAVLVQVAVAADGAEDDGGEELLQLRLHSRLTAAKHSLRHPASNNVAVQPCVMLNLSSSG